MMASLRPSSARRRCRAAAMPVSRRCVLILFLARAAGAAACNVGAERESWGAWAFDAYPPPSSLRVDRGLVYAHDGGRRLLLDLYLPTPMPRNTVPAVVVIRGGGWQQGNKEGYGFVAARLAQLGLAAASVQYTTVADAPFPAAVHDVKAAVRWLRANAAFYRIDPSAITALGGSAGGHLAAMLATSAGAADLEGDGGNPGVSSGVAAAVAMGVAADFVDMSAYSNAGAVQTIERFLGGSLEQRAAARRQASPATYVTKAAAPILLLHSDADPLVPLLQPRLLKRRYDEAGAHAELEIIPGAPHAFWNYTRWFDDVMQRSASFLESVTTRAR
jgi:acetyl esterase/lipase